MVNHDQQRVIIMGRQEISNQVDRQLLKWVDAGGGEGGEHRDSWVGINLHLLAEGTARDEMTNKGGHTRPPVVVRQQGVGVEEPPMS